MIARGQGGKMILLGRSGFLGALAGTPATALQRQPST